MKQGGDMRLSCQGCRHFFVTHDPHRPWGCRNFGFKGKNLPAEIVYLSTGMQCAYYQRRPNFRPTKPKKPLKKGRVDKTGLDVLDAVAGFGRKHKAEQIVRVTRVWTIISRMFRDGR